MNPAHIDSLLAEKILDFARKAHPARRYIGKEFRVGDADTLRRFLLIVSRRYGAAYLDEPPKADSVLSMYGIPFVTRPDIPQHEIHLYSLTDECIGIITVESQ